MIHEVFLHERVDAPLEQVRDELRIRRVAGERQDRRHVPFAVRDVPGVALPCRDGHALAPGDERGHVLGAERELLVEDEVAELLLGDRQERLFHRPDAARRVSERAEDAARDLVRRRIVLDDQHAVPGARHARCLAGITIVTVVPFPSALAT